MKLRDYTEIKILKNINNPIMFLGYPLKLAYMYLGSILLGFISALVLSNFKVNWIINLLIPIIIITIGSSAVALFYKRYGLNNYYLEKLDKETNNYIEGDMSFQMYFKNKKLKKETEKK
jgi:hypothetical protein